MARMCVERGSVMVTPIPLAASIEESRQVRNQSHLWRSLAHDTCCASQRLRQENAQLLLQSRQMVQNAIFLHDAYAQHEAREEQYGASPGAVIASRNAARGHSPKSPDESLLL